MRVRAPLLPFLLLACIQSCTAFTAAPVRCVHASRTRTAAPAKMAKDDKPSSTLNVSAEELAKRNAKRNQINQALPLAAVAALLLNFVSGGALYARSRSPNRHLAALQLRGAPRLHLRPTHDQPNTTPTPDPSHAYAKKAAHRRHLTRSHPRML
jgi:hypothetical protein